MVAMLGIGFQEIIVIITLALIIFGPQKLPELARILGKGLREFRRAADDFRFAIEQEDLKSLEQKPNEPVLSQNPYPSMPPPTPNQKRFEKAAPKPSDDQDGDQSTPSGDTPPDPNNNEIIVLEKHG